MRVLSDDRGPVSCWLPIPGRWNYRGPPALIPVAERGIMVQMRDVGCLGHEAAATDAEQQAMGNRTRQGRQLRQQQQLPAANGEPSVDSRWPFVVSLKSEV